MENGVYRAIARNLRDLMTAKNLSAKELSAQADIPIETVDEALSGDCKTLKIDSLGQLATALNVDIVLLLRQ